MRSLSILLLLAAGAAAQMGPAKRVDSWTSPHNQKRLRTEWDALPEFKPTKLPDGSEVPPRAPWPFVVYVFQNDSKASAKLKDRVFDDTRFVLCSHAVKLVKIKPAKAIDLPYLASVRGIRDPTLIFVNRAFEVVGVLNKSTEFTDRKVLALMEKAGDAAYEIDVSRYVGEYMKILKDGEDLWRDELKIEKLREKAAKSDKAKAASLDKEADGMEKTLEAARADLNERAFKLRDSLVPTSDEKKEALPTTVGSGKKKRELTPEEIEAIKAYREFALNKNPIIRAAAVEDLGAIDSGAMVAVILKAANDVDPRVIDAAGKALARMKSDEALEAMLEGLANGNSKERTAALLGFADNPMPYPKAVPHFIQQLETGNDEVRRAALRALATAGDASAVGALVKALDDPEPALRVLAATALGTLKAADAAPALIGKIDDSDWSLQKAAVEALAKIRVKESIEPLLSAFEKSEGLLTEVLYKALVAITGQDFKYNTQNWRRWWDKYKDGFKVPTAAEVAEMKKKAEAAMRGYYDPRKKRKYHTIETLSRKMVFVIDISTSMRDKIVIPPYAPQEVQDEFPSRVKWDIAEKELTELLATLDRDVFFNIVTFAGKVKMWRDGMQNGSQRTAAIKFVAKLKPVEVARGGGRRGAKSSGGGNEQKTNTYAALMAAFGQADESVPNWKARTKVDTIFFVTDGVPTIGEITDVDKLIEFFTELNRTRGIVIHVVTFDKESWRKLRPLAEKNGGQCVLRGWDGTVRKD